MLFWGWPYLWLFFYRNWAQFVNPQTEWNTPFLGGAVCPHPSWSSHWLHNMENRFHWTGCGQRSPALSPRTSLAYVLPTSPTLLWACPLYRLPNTSSWGPVHVNCGSVQALEWKGPVWVFWDPPFPSPGAEKMQNNPTLSKWQDHYFFSQFEIII